jgi:transmembrane sensor
LSMKPPNPSSLDEQILTQAAHWCMRLHDDTCTTEERLDFQSCNRPGNTPS